MKKTLCVDGNYLLKQSYHGNQYTFDENFGHIGALQTFFTIIRKMIKTYDTTKVIVFWDGLNGGKLRFNEYPYYKSNRKKSWYESEMILTDADIRKLKYLQQQKDEDGIMLIQKLRIQQYCEELFIRQFEFPEIEADDCIAYYCKNIKEEDEEVIIYTNDGDLLMLLEYDNVSVFLGGKGKKELINKYSFNILYYPYHYKNIALIKAIEGCNSDMIHGVSSMGQKTLLKYFPELKDKELSIEYILTRANEINSQRLTTKKKPYVSLENLINGTTAVDVEKYLKEGEHLLDLNFRLVNLLEPTTFMTDEAIESLVAYTTYPIDPSDRGGKNIIKLMMDDGFIKLIPRGADGLVDFLKQFLLVVETEKKLFRENE